MIPIDNEQLFLRIMDSLKNKTPLAVCRYGDGEYLTMTFANDVPFKKHLGAIPSPVQRAGIVSNLYQSFRESDIVGITRHAGGNWTASKNFFKGLANFGVTCDADFHSAFLTDGRLDAIIKQSEKLLLITGHDLKTAFQKKYPHLKEIKQFLITRQPHYFGKTGNPHYPDIFEQTIKSINYCDLKGYLCFTGGGIIGKRYVTECKKQGGTSIDIGSAFDLLAGYRTRGVHGHLTVDQEFKIG